MLFQVTQICFNESDYITLHSIMNIMTGNGAKMTYKMSQQWFSAITIWHTSEKGYYKDTMRDFVVWLICYVHIFAI